MKQSIVDQFGAVFSSKVESLAVCYCKKMEFCWIV